MSLQLAERVPERDNGEFVARPFPTSASSCSSSDTVRSCVSFSAIVSSLKRVFGVAAAGSKDDDCADTILVRFGRENKVLFFRRRFLCDCSIDFPTLEKVLVDSGMEAF